MIPSSKQSTTVLAALSKLKVCYSEMLRFKGKPRIEEMVLKNAGCAK